jgi:serine phosphatase RsbU (regulator of sigma subunit)
VNVERVAGRLEATTLDDLRRPAAAQPTERLRVLLVEDDPGDALLVRELLVEAKAPVELYVAPSMAAARDLLRNAHCVLLDLGLPDATGLDALREVLRARSGAAVCVLTGLEDEHLGIAALSEGAQDYLVKGQVDGILLGRALRYAVERRRAEDNVRRLSELALRQAESARLERGLLPQPLMSTAPVEVVSFYRPGRHRALLGGDFYDAVQTAPQRLHLLVGDVCGHGVDEAALGVELRVAWRALVLAGVPDDAVLPSLEQVLGSERRSEELFATVAMATVDLAGGSMEIRLAGHPPPVLLSDDGVRLCDVDAGLVLGVLPGMPRPATHVALDAPNWALLMYTDGLIEGHAARSRGGDDRAGDDRLGVEGLCELLDQPDRAAVPRSELPGWLFNQAAARNGGPLADDVAVLLLLPDGGR